MVDVVLGIIMGRDGKLLIARRPRGPLAGYWEFPGGKINPGETHAQALARELIEELGIHVRLIEPLAPIEYAYPTARVRLHPWLCEHASGQPQPIGCDDPTWIDAAQLRDHRFPPANDDLIRTLTDRFTRQPGSSAG